MSKIMSFFCFIFMVAGALDNFLRHPKDCTEKYYTGYDSAWEGYSKPSRWSSKDEKEGYEDGLNDVLDYDSGYFDGYNGKGPLDKDNVLYMDGYQNGRNNKKYY